MAAVSLALPPASVVDAHPPAAVAAGNVETSQRITDVLFSALGGALPDLIPALSQGTMNNTTVGGTDPRTGSPFAYYETVGGGMGAGPGGHGLSAVHVHMSNSLTRRSKRSSTRTRSASHTTGSEGAREGPVGIVAETGCGATSRSSRRPAWRCCPSEGTRGLPELAGEETASRGRTS